MALHSIKTILWEPGKTLSQRAARSGIWLMIFQIFNQGFRLIRTLILARLLVPEDFGLVGIAMISISLLDVFSQTGFRQALVQKRGDIKDYLDTAWTISIIRGMVLFGVLFFSAPFIAQFFNNPKAALVIQVMAASLALAGFTNIGIIYFIKELKFRDNIIVKFSETILSLAVSIPLAFIFRNVWAIVFGSLAGMLGAVIFSYIIHPYRPRFSLSSGQAKDLFNFGKYILASGMLIFGVTQGGKILVGKILGTTALGFFTLAYTLSTMVTAQISTMISKVAFPAYSKLQHDLKKLRETYLKILQITAFISFPLAGCIFVFASDFTRLFLGQKWMPMVSALQILALAGLSQSIFATGSPITQGIGKPEIDTQWRIVHLVILGLLVFPLTKSWELTGTSIAVFLSSCIATIGLTYSVAKITKCETKDFKKMIGLPLVNIAIVVLLMLLLKKYGNVNTMLAFFVLIGFGVLSYFGIAYVFDRYLNYGLKAFIKEIMNSL